MAIQKIKKILIPLDGSKNSLRGLDMAVSQAQITGSSITGIYVFPHAYEMYYWRRSDISDALKKNASKIMKVARNHVKRRVEFNEKIMEGDPGPMINKFAQSNNVDLIVIGARGLGSIKETFLGSTSHYTVHKSKVPVLVVK